MDYRREIDGLRALAVLPVILFHAGFKSFSGGFVGVDVFFVISGYLITTIIISELDQGRFSIVGFYERRARRILPALFLVMLACIPFAWFWLLPSDLKAFSQSLAAVSVFVSNVLFWSESGYFDTAAEFKPLLHTWSLAVEEQYYLLFPLLLMLIWRMDRFRVLMLLAMGFFASLAVAQWGAYAKPAAAFYLLPARGWELLVGAFAAFYLTQPKREEFSKGLSEIGAWLGVALILYAVFAYSEATPFPGFYALVPTVGAVLIILFATQQTTAGRLVGSKPLVGLGLISYSAYLWHQPLFAFARHRSEVEISSTTQIMILLIMTLVLAALTWQFVEQPFREKKRFSRRSIFSFALMGSLLFIAAGFGLQEKAKSDHVAVDYKWSEKVRQNLCLLQDAEAYQHDPSCFVRGEKNVLLWGDSNAAALYPGLSNLANRNSLSLTQLTQSGCPPLHQIKTLNERQNCNLVNQEILKHISDVNYDAIIVHGGWIHPDYPMSDDDLESKFSDMIKLIKDKSPKSRLIVISNVPKWYISAERAYKFNHSDDGQFFYAKARTFPQIDERLARVSAANGAFFISPVEKMCKLAGKSMEYNDCLIKADRRSDYLAYIDWNHLSDSGADYLADQMESQIIGLF